MNKDIYIKDEGDFATAIFQTEKAKRIAREGDFAEELYGSKVDVELTSLSNFLVWAMTHGLQIDSEVPIIPPSKEYSNN